MAGLQRSAVSFRRQGSSGLVWDDKLVSEELNKDHDQIQDQKGAAQLNTRTTTTPITVQRSRSTGGYRTGKVSPAIEPPSPKVSACGFCTAFGKSGDKTRRKKPKQLKHRSRQAFSGHRRRQFTRLSDTKNHQVVQDHRNSRY